MFDITVLSHEVIEKLINKASVLDPTFNARIAILAGKRLAVTLTSPSFSISFQFSHQYISVLNNTDDADCSIITTLDALPELQQPANITKLIKSDQLQLDGDIQLAQQFAQLLKETDIDWEEHLSRLIGDGPAHKLCQLLKTISEALVTRKTRAEETFTELMQDELKVTPHPLEITQFGRNVNLLSAETDKLEARINALKTN